MLQDDNVASLWNGKLSFFDEYVLFRSFHVTNNHFASKRNICNLFAGCIDNLKTQDVIDAL